MSLFALRIGSSLGRPLGIAFICAMAASLWSSCGADRSARDAAEDTTDCSDALRSILTRADAAGKDSARIAVLEGGRNELQRNGTPACERELLLELADLHERLGHTGQVITVCDTLLATMPLSTEQTAMTKVKLAKACFALGLPRAFDLAKDVFRHYQGQHARSDRMIEATDLLVTTYNLTGDNTECVHILGNALKDAEQQKDIRWTCDLLDRLGAIASEEGRGKEGIAFHERSIDLLDRFFKQGAVRDTLLVRTVGSEPKVDGSVPGTDTIRELLTQRHYVSMRHRALKLLGDAQAAAGDPTSAATSYRKAIASGESSFIPDLVLPYAELGQILLTQGNAAEAARLGELARVQASEQHDAKGLMRTAELLHSSYKRLGDEHRSLEMLELLRTCEDSLNDLSFRMGLVRKQATYAARADSLLMRLKIDERERQMNDAQAKARRNRNATFAVGGAAILLLAASGLWYRSDRRRRLERFEKDAAVLETQALRSQMNPHFIFNALNSINAFVQGNDPDMASSYLSKFARVMRLVLENSRHAEVPLESDLEALRGYLDLERKRMRDKFDYTIHIDPKIDPSEVMVPPLVVQPFVENAIWHGMAGKEGTGHITLRVQQKGEQLLWIIEDDGVGRNAHQAMKEASENDPGSATAPVKKTSLGTAITRARLDLVQKQYGGKAGWNYVDTPTGTRVEVDMPMRTGS